MIPARNSVLCVFLHTKIPCSLQQAYTNNHFHSPNKLCLKEFWRNKGLVILLFHFPPASFQLPFTPCKKAPVPYVLVVCFWSCALVLCFGRVLWSCALPLCLGPCALVLACVWSYALVVCSGLVLWSCALVVSFGLVLWSCALPLCLGPCLLLVLCFGRVFWSCALVLCFGRVVLVLCLGPVLCPCALRVCVCNIERKFQTTASRGTSVRTASGLWLQLIMGFSTTASASCQTSFRCHHLHCSNVVKSATLSQRGPFLIGWELRGPSPERASRTLPQAHGATSFRSAALRRCSWNARATSFPTKVLNPGGLLCSYCGKG